MKTTINSIAFVVAVVCLFSCKTKDYRCDEMVSMCVIDTAIEVKISCPEEWTKTNKIIIWSLPPLTDEFFHDSDSIINKKDGWMPPILRQALLDAGYVNIEYIGRNDSVMFMGRKYRASDSNTQANDLESLLNYIHSNNRLKNKKIILVGYSEGGDTNIKVASKRQDDIAALLQLASRSLSGIQTSEYQREKVGYFDFLIRTFKPDFFDKPINEMSSLDSNHTGDIEGVKQFFKENILPIEKFIYEFKNMDSVYFHIDLYLRDRWQKEDEKTKNSWENNFDSYYQAFAGNITPQQITLKTIKPERYYPLIKCPVLAVQGTEDERIDCYPNMDQMEQLLKNRGNSNFKKIILEGYNHNLAKWDGSGYYVDESVIQEIIEWVNGQ